MKIVGADEKTWKNRGNNGDEPAVVGSSRSC